MAYSNESKFFKIPIPEYGDSFSVSEEARKANIIDTQLFGSILAHSGGHGILVEGTWSSSFAADNSSVSLASPNASTLPSIVAFFSQIFTRTVNTLTWTGLLNSLKSVITIGGTCKFSFILSG